MVAIFIWIAGVTAVIIAIFFIYYNRFVRLSHQIDNSLAQISVQLRKAFGSYSKLVIFCERLYEA